MGFPGCSIPTLPSHTVNIALAYCLCFGRGLQMGFQDVAFLLSRASFAPHFFNNVVEMKASGPPHVLILWVFFGW